LTFSQCFGMGSLFSKEGVPLDPSSISPWDTKHIQTLCPENQHFEMEEPLL
jgi:hypothetical protein